MIPESDSLSGNECLGGWSVKEVCTEALCKSVTSKNGSFPSICGIPSAKGSLLSVYTFDLKRKVFLI